ncbi:MAG: cytochrome c biogenesis protein CcdA [Flavobacteriaceae bacterium]
MKKWLVFILWSSFIYGQVEEPVKWETSVISDTIKNIYTIRLKANIEKNWHLYSQFSDPNGAIPTEFKFKKNKKYRLIGKVNETKSTVAYDEVFEMDLSYFTEKAIFTQKIEIFDTNLNKIEAEVNYQACDDKLCIFRNENFYITLDGSNFFNNQTIDKRSKDLSSSLKLNLKNTSFINKTQNEEGIYSYFNVFILGFIGGLLALLTPCVFPMIPLTVSFFLKQSISSKRGVLNALTYTFFIVLIYCLLSLPFHFIDSLDPEFLNSLATNIYVNIIFFLVFVLFAFSFFGFYEITLPTTWGNKSDQASAINGIIGIFFMALTLAIVSFSCTGPILGSLLAGSITADGGATQLSFGMLGFGVALGFPFGLFALFPNTLNVIPKSGSWMNTVKVVLGFLELALALKFLSNADLVANWGLLKREVFLVIWILITLSLTLYLFGLFRFPHDSKVQKSKTRYSFAFLSLIITSYLFFGLVSKENTLKLISGFPPPEFYSLRAIKSDCPLGLECYKDYELGIQKAVEQQKPILLDFTGWACVNCRKMEENVWSDPEVYPILRDKFIIISLYVDDRKILDEKDQFDFQLPNGRIKRINTVGKKWATFQTINFNTASQPFYVQITSDGTLLNSPIQYTGSVDFKNWLETGLYNYKPLIKANYIKL